MNIYQMQSYSLHEHSILHPETLTMSNWFSSANQESIYHDDSYLCLANLET